MSGRPEDKTLTKQIEAEKEHTRRGGSKLEGLDALRRALRELLEEA